MTSGNGKGKSESPPWMQRAVGPVDLVEYGGSLGSVWPTDGSVSPHWSRVLRNRGGDHFGVSVRFSGPAIEEGFVVPRKIDTRSGRYKKRSENEYGTVATRLLWKREDLSRSFSNFGQSFGAEIPIQLEAGFVYERDYEYRLRLKVGEAKPALKHWELADMSLVIWYEPRRDDEASFLFEVFDLTGEKLLYSEQLTTRYR